MVAPIVAAAAIGLGTALANWLNSKAGRDADEAERKRIEGLVNSINTPGFDMSDITPDEYQAVAKYVPKAADFIEEQAPQVVKMDSEDAKLARSSYKQVLSKLASFDESQFAKEQSLDGLDAARQQASAMDASLKDDMARRGLSGSGTEMLNRMLSGQQQAKNAAVVGRQARVDAYKAALQNMAQRAEMADNLENKEYAYEKNNNDIINSFNERTANRKQAWADSAANMNNDAQWKNIQLEQDIANKNVTARNAAKAMNKDTNNDLKQRQFDNNIAKTKIAAGISDSNRNAIANNTRSNADIISSVGDTAGTIYDYSRSSTQKQNSTRQPGTSGDFNLAATQGPENTNNRPSPQKQTYTPEPGTGRSIAMADLQQPGKKKKKQLDIEELYE